MDSRTMVCDACLIEFYCNCGCLSLSQRRGQRQRQQRHDDSDSNDGDDGNDSNDGDDSDGDDGNDDSENDGRDYNDAGKAKENNPKTRTVRKQSETGQTDSENDLRTIHRKHAEEKLGSKRDSHGQSRQNILTMDFKMKSKQTLLLIINSIFLEASSATLLFSNIAAKIL